MRDHILNEIKRLARENDNRPPGYKLFFRETGIADHHWRGKFWARWSDALSEAGYSPNRWQERLDLEEVLLGVIAACRHYARFPTQDEIQLYRKLNASVPSAQAIKRHLGNRTDLIAALATYTSENDGYADIAAVLPNVSKARDRSLFNRSEASEGFVYLFKSGDFYKVGRSDDLERRIKEIGIKLPEKLTPIHSIRTDDPSGIEAYWHRRFADKRANGEWFKLSSVDIAAFKKRKYQ